MTTSLIHRLTGYSMGQFTLPAWREFTTVIIMPYSYHFSIAAGQARRIGDTDALAICRVKGLAI
jgi:hypothetical protein